MFTKSATSEIILRKDHAINRANALDDFASVCRREGMSQKDKEALTNGYNALVAYWENIDASKATEFKNKIVNLKINTHEHSTTKQTSHQHTCKIL